MRRRLYKSLLPFGLAALTAGCASTGAVPQPFPRPGAEPSWAPPRVGTVPGDGYTIAGTALSLRGAPYRDGGSDPSGFDCSGFITYVFGQHGIAVPRTVTLQFAAGEGVQSDELRAGDLVFFSTTAPGPSHVGMLIGGDEFVHAPSTRGEVRVERLQSTYWAPRFIGARRLVR
jgi:cell wall-associated NlpC family hydrolase